MELSYCVLLSLQLLLPLPVASVLSMAALVVAACAAASVGVVPPSFAVVLSATMLLHYAAALLRQSPYASLGLAFACDA